MSIQLQSMSTVLSVSPEKTELLTIIKNEPEIVEIGINDILDSSDEDEESIPDIKDIDIVSHELSEDLIKSETVSENTFENNHSGSVETQVFVKTENTPLIKTKNITQSEYLYKNQDISDKQNKKSYFCKKCTFISKNRSYFKRHKLSHKTELEVDGWYLKYRCDRCEFKTCWSRSLRRHKLKHLKSEEILYFYCYHCSFKSKQKGVLKRHIFNHFKKEEVPFHCYICDFMTLKRNLIIEHFKKHPKHHSKCDEVDYKNQVETYTKYRCDKCKFKTCRSDHFKNHKLTHLKPEEIQYFYCYHCSFKSKRKGDIKRHIFNHFKKGEVPFHCYICDFMTLKRNRINEHFKKHPKHHSKCDETDYKNQLETYTKKRMRHRCKKCSFETYQYVSLKLHELTHKKEVKVDDLRFKYCCDKCKYKTCWSSNFKRHKLMHLKPEEIPYFYCYHCPYKCKEKSSLKIHIFNHFKKEEVPFHCYICDFTTLKRDLIVEHFKTHPKHHSKYDETEYKNQLEIPYFYCYHCPYKCTVKSSLKIHIFNHFKKEEVSFHCYFCDFTTIKRDLIIEHFKKHSKHHSKCDKTDHETYTKRQMRYCCEKCTYTGGNSSNFKRHQLTHKIKAEIDDRLYQRNALKVHKLTHLKREEIHYFYCYHCSYKSKYKSDLQKHILCHFKNEDVQFHCYICDFTTLKRNLITEHFKKHPKHHSKCGETKYRNQLLRFYKIL